MFEQIYATLLNFFSGKYTIIKSYDEEEQINLNGVIAITLDRLQNVHNGNLQDFKLSVSINGQTFVEQDKSKEIILQMFDYVLSKLNPKQIQTAVEDCVGVLTNTGQLTSDGETNNFSYSLDLYICKN